MKHYVDEIVLQTKKTQGLYDITDKIIEIIDKSRIKEGQAVVQSMHATTGIYVNEPEENLYMDFLIHLNHQVPNIPGHYQHDNLDLRDCPDDEPLNGHSHLKSALYSQNSAGLIIHENKLMLGRYQHIFFAEFDGPCPRKHKTDRICLVSVLGE